MVGRLDLPEHGKGCRTVENVVVKTNGGGTRRPGFEHLSAAYSHSYASRLIGFVNGSDRYILEFSNLKMRVFHDGEVVQSGGSDYVLTTPWTEAQVADLVFAPGGAAIFHPDFDPRELVCEGDADWTLTEFSSTYGPWLKENANQANTIAPSATTGSVTLTAAGTGHEPFVTGASGHVGALVRLTQEIGEAATAGTLYNTGNSSEVTISGAWQLTLSGRWAGNVKFQRSTDGGTTWIDVRNYYRKTPGSAVIVDKGEETEQNVSYRLNVTWIGTPDPPDSFLETFFNAFYDSLRYEIKADHAWQTGVARITAVTSSTVATATVLAAFGSTDATYKYALGAWSPYQGYPACGTIHDSRIYAAATARQPKTLWAGRPFLKREDARLFDVGTTYEDDDPITRTLDVRDCNVIRWLESLWVMLIGSDGNLVKGIGPGENLPATGKDFNAMPQSGMGSSSLQPVRVAGYLVYAGRDGKRVYEMTYSDDARVYQPQDLTHLADHIAGSGIAGWAFQQQPQPILWAYTTDGNLFGITRDRDRQVIACHRHPLGGDGAVESIAVSPGDTSDEVWMSVRRTINGSTYRSIEKMRPFDWGTEQRDAWFVDGGTIWDGGAAVAVTGISVAAGTGRVTVTAAGMTDGWTIRIAGVVGMEEVNGRVYTVADATATTFTLKTRDGTAYINGAAFTDYASGGTVERVANSITGLTHLAGATVAALLDGQPATGTVTAAGVYTIGTGKDRYYKNTIIVGHDVTWVLEPMPYYSAASKHRVSEVSLWVYQSAGGKMGSTADDAVDIPYDETGESVGQDVALFSGMILMNTHPGGWDQKVPIYLTGNGPMPFTATAIRYKVE